MAITLRGEVVPGIGSAAAPNTAQNHSIGCRCEVCGRAALPGVADSSDPDFSIVTNDGEGNNDGDEFDAE